MSDTATSEYGEARSVDSADDTSWKVEILRVEIVKGFQVDTGREYQLKVLGSEMKLLKLRIGEDGGEVLSGCKYELKIGDETFSGETNEEGVILQHVPRDATRGELHFWVDEDDDEPHVWPIKIK